VIITSCLEHTNYILQVEFKVNDVKRKFPMKVGEGGEAFFVFETSENIPQDLQTSPVISPTTSPQAQATGELSSIGLPEPEPLDLTKDGDMLKPGPPDEIDSMLERPKSADGENI
jgi:phosphatidate phosphatase LPIN